MWLRPIGLRPNLPAKLFISPVIRNRLREVLREKPGILMDVIYISIFSFHQEARSGTSARRLKERCG